MSLLLVAAGSLLLACGTELPQGTTYPPRWHLNVPPGLPSAHVEALFEQGRDKMRDGDQRSDRRDALLDFYRILQTEPGFPYADKFAYAAGEHMVVAVLEEELQRRVSERGLRDAERTQLLEDAREGPRQVQLRAMNKLKRQFGDDEIILEELRLTPSAESQEKELLRDNAFKHLSEGKYDAASHLFQELLDRTTDRASRKTALTSLQVAQLELAREGREPWSQGVTAAAMGAQQQAHDTWSQLAEAHPAHPSARLHLQRVP